MVRLSDVLPSCQTLPFNGSMEVDITAEGLPNNDPDTAQFGKC